MNKRRFLLAGALGATVASSLAAGAASERTGCGLLTVTGAIARSNRGPIDLALDQLMVKHGRAFDRAWEFDAAMLARLPAVTIQPTLEYDAKPHKLSGPLLASVLGAAGVAAGAAVTLTLRAIDGYAVAVSLADASRYRMIVATTIDGRPMSRWPRPALGRVRRRPHPRVRRQAAQAAFRAEPVGALLHRGQGGLSSPARPVFRLRCTSPPATTCRCASPTRARPVGGSSRVPSCGR